MTLVKFIHLLLRIIIKFVGKQIKTTYAPSIHRGNFNQDNAIAVFSSGITKSDNENADF